MPGALPLAAARGVRLLVGAALVLGLVPAAVRSGEPEGQGSPGAHARAFAQAVAAGDRARADALAAERAAAPILVADALAAPCAEAAQSDRPLPTDALAAAAAWAERTAPRPDAAGVAAVVTRWATWAAEDWRRDARLRAAFAAVDGALAAARAPQALTLAAAAWEADPIVGSVAAVRLALVAAAAALRAPDGAGRSLVWAERAVAAAADLPSADLEADALAARVEALERLQDWPRLEQAADEALAAATRLGRTAGGVGLHLARIDALRGVGRYRDALRSARALATAPATPKERAGLVQVEAILCGALGDYDAAFALFGRAADLYREIGERRGPPKMRQMTAFYLANRGDLAEARRLLDGVVAEFTALAEPQLAAQARAERAEILLDLGLRGEALADVEAALADARQAGRLGEQARWLVVLAGAEGASRDLGAAARHLAEARDLHRQVGNARAAWTDTTQLALVRSRAGAPAEALALLDELGARAAEAAPAALLALGRARGLVLADLGRDEQALAELTPLSARRAARGMAADVGVERRRARVLLRQGRPAEALEAALAALASRETQTRGHAPEEMGALRHLVHADADLALEALEALPAGPGAPDRLDAALTAMEWSRARWLAEDLALAPLLAAAAVPAEAIEAEERAEQEVRRAQAALLALEAAPPSPASDLEAPARRLADALGASVAARASISSAHRRLAHLLDRGAALRTSAVARALPAGTLLLLYHLGEERDYVLALPGGAPGSARLVPLPRTPDGLTRADDWLALLAAPGSPESGLAATLGAVLLAPLAAELAAARRVLISPDRQLAFLPFEALQWGPAGQPPRRLIETHEVAYVPSATVLARLDAQAVGTLPGAGALVLGDPVYASPAGGTPWVALPESGEEARAVAALLPGPATRLLLGAQATRAELDAALAAPAPRRRAIHLACHGFFDPELPGASGLVLGGGEVLTPSALLRRRFDADLVALSACETGRGAVRVGDGVDGLARSLFVAGAPRVLVSGWRVPDRGTRDLMEAFYRAWIERQESPASALRSAKRAALAAGGERAHPSRWASFTLWGLPD